MPSGAIGEHFVLCELMRRGYTCLSSPNPVNKEWDTVVYDRGANVGVTLQVKTVRWPERGSSTKAVLSGNFSADFDFLVVVVLNFAKDDDYLVYVVPKADVVAAVGQKGGIPRNNSEKFRFKNKTIPFSTFADARRHLDAVYGGKWNQVVDLLTRRSNRQSSATLRLAV